MRQRTTLATVVLLAAGLGVAPAATASTGGWQTGHFEWGEITEDTCDVPGLTVEDVGSGDSRFRVLLRGPAELPYEAEHSLDTDIYTNLANEKSAKVVEQRNGRAVSVTDNGDGTITVVYVNDSLNVMYDGAGNVIGRAAGSISVTTLWDAAGTPSNRDDDQFLSLHFDRRSGTELDFCGALVPAIT
jgi:hypothetical protein